MSRLPEPIGDEVRRELGRFGPAGSMGEIVAAWPAAVGDSIARNSWPARVGRDGTLYVATSSSAWAFELGLLEGEILGRLATALGEVAPARLRFAPGRLPEPAREVPEASTRPPQPSSEDRQEAARLTASIEDENLRKVVAKAAASSLARAAERPQGLID